MWCHSKDPDYQKKMRGIVRLYVKRPSGEPVLCVDEKTGMQALSRSRNLQAPQAGRAGRFEFEYKRNGTRCLFACFNVATGRVLGRCTTSRKRPDFFSFMDLVASTYRQRRVHVVLDNLNTHQDTRQGFISDWNRRHGRRFVFHYTPTHGSWLNQVELWFGIVSRRILRYGNFHTPDELIAAIEHFIALWNETESHPFRWTYEGTPLVR
jgi:transposase